MFARWTPFAQDGDAPLDGSVQAGWNAAAESFDAELSAARAFGPPRVLVAGRAFHHAFCPDSARYAVAGGAAIRRSSRLSLAGGGRAAWRGQAFETRFDTPGRYRYYGVPHRALGMSGEIVVT